jgi:hypothetical protein
VPHNEQDLTTKEYYLLGCLAEWSGYGGRRFHRYTAEAERLVQRGYLGWAATGVPIGNSRYIITPKGQAAWQAYRFTGL